MTCLVRCSRRVLLGDRPIVATVETRFLQQKRSRCIVDQFVIFGSRIEGSRHRALYPGQAVVRCRVNRSYIIRLRGPDVGSACY